MHFYNDNQTPLPKLVYQICPRCQSCRVDQQGWFQGSAPEEILLTRDLVNRLRTNGSFTTATIKALGLPRRPPKGWAQALIGTKIPRSVYEAALKGVGCYSNYTLKMKGKA